MESFEQNQSRKVKKSPYADSIYECAYIESEIGEKPAREKREKKGMHRGLKAVLVLLLMAACCVATAVGVTSVWQKRWDRMEAAVEDKFQALEELYTQPQNPTTSHSAPQDLMTPSEVYAQNVNAVVAVNTFLESGGSYGEASGSGFFISADGYVVTNCHVVEGATKIEVNTHGGESYEAELVGSDATNDIALLKVDAENLPFVTIGSSDALVVGDQVAAIGNPLGELASTMTVGYVSAKDRVVSTDGTVINMLQTDAAINSGNSGGPLFNMNGEVVGITTAKYSGNSGNGVTIEGLGFAIPMDDVMGMFADLREFGYVTGAYLGVYVRDVEAAAQAYGLPAGAYVEEPMEGMAADRAGILAGDIIVNLGGYDITCITDLTRVLRRFEAGDETSITVYRKGKLEYLTIVLDEKPVEPEEVPQEQAPEEVEPEVPFEDGFGSFDDWFGFFDPFGWFGNG